MAGLQVVGLVDRVEEHWSTVRDAFLAIDKDHSGGVSAAEFVRELKHLNINVDEELALELAAEFDEDGDGQVNFGEFCEALAKLVAEVEGQPTARPHRDSVDGYAGPGLPWEASGRAAHRRRHGATASPPRFSPALRRGASGTPVCGGATSRTRPLSTGRCETSI